LLPAIVTGFLFGGIVMFETGCALGEKIMVI